MKKLPFFFSILWFQFACSSHSPTTEPITAVSESPQNTLELTEAQLKNAQLSTGKAVTRNLSSKLQVNGVVEVPPHNLVSVSMPMGGFLKSCALLEGSPVRKGQVLAIFEDPSYIQLQQDYLSAMTKTELAQSELQRQQELAKENINAQKQVQQAANTLRLLQIESHALAEKLRLLGIKPEQISPESISRTVALHSPISGFVSKINANAGKYLQATDVLLELVNPDDFHASLTVFEKDLGKIAIGQSVEVFLPNQPKRNFPAKIILISHSLDAQRTATVHCHFDRSEPQLVPGMFLQANILSSASAALTVPSEAVLRFENRHFVFVERAPRQFEMVPVTVQASEGEFVAIQAVENEDLSQVTLVLSNAYTLLGMLHNRAEE